MQQKKQLIQTRDVFIVAVYWAAMMVVGSIWDYPIKDQYHFHLPGSPIVMMAGIYEPGHFSIMTTEPNRWMRNIHPRMPVVLRPNEIDCWLYGNPSEYTALFDRNSVELTCQREAG